MNVQLSLIQELMLYKLELSQNTIKAAQNICGMKDEGAVDNSAVARRLKKFHSDYKGLDDQKG